MRKLQLLDSPHHYGRISRLLHWTMSILFIWLFAGLYFEIVFGWRSKDSWIVPSHPNLGMLLGVLALVRSIWALLNWKRRTSYGQGRRAVWASAGHSFLYGLMLFGPLLAIVHWIGLGHGFSLYGIIPMFPAGVSKPALVHIVEATCSATSLTLHGWVGWALLATIGGHLVMVGVHCFVWRTGIIVKMIGQHNSHG
ncbi:cytochrome b [uncultured Pseudomonas sp.]|uniref:cytochrome b n=1 Tax=Pseudomonas citronellolis TaxID=53408 RepID=UPI0035A6F06F